MEWIQSWGFWAIAIIALGALIAVVDILQPKSSVRRNFPLLGNLRYLLIEIGPELRQYIVANNREELPFSRNEREWIHRSAERKNNYFGFGTDEMIYGIGYPIIKHAAFPHGDEAFTGSISDKPADVPCAKLIGEYHGRRRPFRPTSIINVSAMSFGSLGKNAISALNKGAAIANCYHNTGEGGLSPYHRLGADVCFHIGTGYFGCRDLEGNFDLETLKSLCEKYEQIRMIEVKLSQGAKPGKGGTLPGAKVTAEIAETRGVPEGENCISPNKHKAFDSVPSMLEFIERIAEATGLPVGIKSAVGHIDFWEELAEQMAATGTGPDFITIDGGEGGTGAAPLTFADHVSLPYKLAFTRVYELFQKNELTDGVAWIGSGKLGFPDRAIVAIALGADLIHVARESMMAIGCIQAQKCHTGFCPTGVATHNAWLQRGLDIDVQSHHLANYFQTFRNELNAVAHAAGYEHPGQFTPLDIELSAGPSQFKTLYELFGYNKKQYAPELAPVFKDPENIVAGVARDAESASVLEPA